MDIIIYILSMLGGIFLFIAATLFIVYKNESEDVVASIILSSLGIMIIILVFAKFKSDVEEDTVIKLLNKDIAVDTIATNPYNGRITEVKILE